MGIIELLSSVRGLRGNDNEIALAHQIAEWGDHAATKELVENLSNQNKRIQSDCLKCLYEISYIKPELISGYINDFFRLLKSKNNRLVWGSMIALSSLSELKHKYAFTALLNLRFSECEKDSQRKRIEKVLKKIS